MDFRGVLFDSGDTLIRPVGGRWNPRPDFEEAAGSFPAAFAAGQKVLDGGQTTPSLADYHLTILHTLGIGRAAPRLLWQLEQPGARPLVEPFPEVPDVLERLRARGVRMYRAGSDELGLSPDQCLFVPLCPGSPRSRISPSLTRESHHPTDSYGRVPGLSMACGGGQ